MIKSPKIWGAAMLAIAAGSGMVLAQSGASGPKARYYMDVGTTTGMAAMGSGMGAGMSMMFGGGKSREAHEIHLRLGSTQTPTGGAAKADHYFVPAAKMGKSVPLTYDPSPKGEDGEWERPKGRLILFWGCGAKAGKGQPVIIDFAKLAAGQIPPGLFSVRVPRDRGPTPATSRTYGDWPNSKGGKPPGNGSSLLGDHRIAGNYSPEIKFNLTQDYMAGLTGNAAANPLGGTSLSWNGIAGATGYHAWAMGFKSDGNSEPRDFVWWSSSATKEFGAGLWDWLSPDTARRLVGEKVLMPPSQTSCTIPAEFKTYAPDMTFATIYAYGPEANFAYPPKPPTGPWVIDWTAKVRYRSMTSVMVGGPPGMGAASGQGSQPERKCKPSPFGILTGKGC